MPILTRTFPNALRLAVSALILLAVLATGAWAQSASPGAGEKIYRQGLLPSGQPLSGTRTPGGRVEGAAVACVNCHRRSGLGTTEGKIVIPPITGKYLFRPSAENAEDGDPTAVAASTVNRDAYTDETLIRAIREGIRPDGHELSYLMPRFDLDDAAMASLLAYLKELNSGPVPGVSDDTLQFATVITPDADPVKRQGMLDVLEHFFAEKNKFYRGASPKLVASRQMMFRVTRKWQFHVWQLTGPPQTWEQQLREHQRAEPVFALISGLGGKTWAPVHRFCEQESIPCLLPNVDLPVVAENDFYSIYFSKGVLLEAQLIAHQLQQRQPGPQRLVQVFRQGDVGEDAADAMRALATPAGVKTVQLALKADGSPRELADALKAVRRDDTVILWLRSKDLASLPVTAPKGATVFVSGLLGGLEHAPLPAQWRTVARMTYPFDLPDLRAVRMNFPLGWFKIHNIAVVDEHVQSDTYLACVILAEMLGHMLDNFVRDYLVERDEVMLSYRLVNAYYPRLSLAPGQRFASKGGYIVRFAEPDGPRLVADGDWIVP